MLKERGVSMLLLLASGLLLGSVFTLILRRNRESLLLAALCLSLTIYLVGIMLLIAKRGGISASVEKFLYFSHDIRLWFQYRFITFDQLGLIINVGRHLFPMFLLMMAERYSMVTFIRKRPALTTRLTLLLPVLTMLLYLPQAYSTMVSSYPFWRAVLFYLSYTWIIAYLLLSVALLFYELFSITMPFFRRQFLMLVACLAGLSVLYFIYCGQDPGQVYSFYSYDYIGIRGVGYMLLMPGLRTFILLVAVNVVGGVLGIGMLLRYTEDTLSPDREDAGLERKFDVARTGASVFVHGIKNQLLANRVLYKRIRAELDRPEPDMERLRSSVERLSEINDNLVSRSEELYRTVKSKSVLLVPVPLRQVCDLACDRFGKKYPEALLEVSLPEGVQILADENYLAEAIYNLMTNAWEANVAAGHDKSPVELLGHVARLYTVIEVRDHGKGIDEDEKRRIFEPFYSSKNTNFNWGMGLYHVRTIVRSHLGSMRVENMREGGADFYILLPRYDGRTRREGRHR